MTLQKEPTILVIFGGLGDLTWRKLAPALYNLLLAQQLPEHFAVIGLDIKAGSADEFRLRLRDGVHAFCECGEIDEKTWTRFAASLSYISGDFADPATYAAHGLFWLAAIVTLITGAQYWEQTRKALQG